MKVVWASSGAEVPNDPDHQSKLAQAIYDAAHASDVEPDVTLGVYPTRRGGSWLKVRVPRGGVVEFVTELAKSEHVQQINVGVNVQITGDKGDVVYVRPPSDDGINRVILDRIARGYLG